MCNLGRLHYVIPGSEPQIDSKMQGRTMVVVDVEAQSNIYSPNVVPEAYFPGIYFRNL